MQTAPFKPERFEHVVEHYIAARLRYAPDLIEWLAREANVAGRRVLDLGCGPGFIANAIAPFAGDVVGLDPSEAMIDAASAQAAQNARFLVGSSLDLSVVEAPIQLVTMGRSFHWMDRTATLLDLDQHIVADGAIAILFDRVIDCVGNRWYATANAVAKSYAVKDAYAEHRSSGEWLAHEEVLIDSPFSHLTQIVVYQRHQWTFETFLRFVFSRSATTEALLGDKKAALVDELRATLSPFGQGPWVSLHQHIALIAKRQSD